MPRTSDGRVHHLDVTEGEGIVQLLHSLLLSIFASQLQIVFFLLVMLNELAACLLSWTRTNYLFTNLAEDL